MRRARIPILALALVLLASGPFAKQPVVAGPAPEPSADAVIADLPFEEAAPWRIYLNLAAKDSKPFRMMVDTGATFSVLTPGAARDLGVTVRRLKRTPYRRGTSLGRDVQFWVADSTSDQGSSTGWEYGLLGGNFLQEYVVEFDFVRRRVRFLDPKKYEVPRQVDSPNERVERLRLTSGRPFMDIEINGAKSQVIVDTGAPGTAIVSGKAAKKLGIDVDSLPAFGVLGTVKGDMPVKLYETDTFRFAGFDFEQIPILVAPRGWYNQAGNTDSVVGMDVIQHFTVRVDYPRGRIWLRRERSNVTYLNVEYSLTRRAGVFTFPLPNGYLVIGTAAGSPARAMGIEPGDQILQAAGYTRRTLEEIIGEIERGEPILVARPKGKDDFTEIVLPKGSELARSEALQEAAAVRDEARIEDFEKQKQANLYMEVNGGWVLVDGYRKRLGPREGEQWFSFDEMQAIKAERAANEP